MQFNFPVSEFCAAALRHAYALEEIGPVDPAWEARTPGRMLGLCLSGGLDSMAIWVALRRMLGDNFRVITLQLGGGFAFEERGYSIFRRDVTCRTDIVQAGLYTNPRVVFVAPLLFAEYLDLGSIAPAYADAEWFDFSFLDTLSLAFMERYNTNLTQDIPASLRAPYLRVLHAAGIEPYREGDWEELEQMRAFNQALSDDRAPRRVSQANARQV